MKIRNARQCICNIKDECLTFLQSTGFTKNLYKKKFSLGNYEGKKTVIFENLSTKV